MRVRNTNNEWMGGSKANERWPANRSSVARLGRLVIDYGINGELYDQCDIDREVIVVEGGSFHPIADVLDQYRAQFVRDQKWMPPDHLSDYDDYDDPAMWTRSFVDVIHDKDEGDIIISSLRLSQVDRLEDCISLVMAGVENRGDLPATARAKIAKAEEDGALYDLTRLLPPAKKILSSEEYFESVAKLIGYGIQHTIVEAEADPVWLFATTSGIQEKLECLGMPSEAVASIRRPGERRTILCCVKPAEALAYLLEHKKEHESTYNAIRQGIIEAGRTISV